jgi:hypothetical protein
MIKRLEGNRQTRGFLAAKFRSCALMVPLSIARGGCNLSGPIDMHAEDASQALNAMQ